MIYDRGVYGEVETVEYLIDSDLISLADPLESLLLFKPLPENEGGMAHGGVAKILNASDELYQGLLNWISYTALCHE